MTNPSPNSAPSFDDDLRITAVDQFAGPGADVGKHRFLTVQWGYPPGNLTECWATESPGWENGNGYFRVTFEGTRIYRHRLAYEAFVGGIPEDLAIDHLCFNRACWNPLHLQPVTNAENILRGESFPAKNLRKEACPKCGTEYRREGQYRKCPACKQANRSDTQRKGIGRSAERTHCPKGHPYNEANTYWAKWPDGSFKGRACRECSRESVRRRRARQKGGATV